MGTLRGREVVLGPSAMGSPHVRDPQRPGSPQQGRSMREAKRVCSFIIAMGSLVELVGAGLREGHDAQGLDEQTLSLRDLQNAWPNLWEWRD
jgi:hypothetical protein